MLFSPVRHKCETAKSHHVFSQGGKRTWNHRDLVAWTSMEKWGSVDDEGPGDYGVDEDLNCHNDDDDDEDLDRLNDDDDEEDGDSNIAKAGHLRVQDANNCHIHHSHHYHYQKFQ